MENVRREDVSTIATSTPGKLYLGPVGGLREVEEYKIDLVIGLFPPLDIVVPETIFRIEFSLTDRPQDKEKMRDVLDETNEIIHNTLQRGQNVFVHCFAGISRSSTVVLDYLLTYENLQMKRFQDALAYLRTFRPQVNPNIGFVELLKERHSLE
jgi:protein-tyrosine phosphatase